MIKVENLSKIFKSSKKFPGFFGSLKGLFTREYTDLYQQTFEVPDSITDEIFNSMYKTTSLGFPDDWSQEGVPNVTSGR